MNSSTTEEKLRDGKPKLIVDSRPSKKSNDSTSPVRNLRVLTKVHSVTAGTGFSQSQGAKDGIHEPRVHLFK